jgi:ribosomal protein L34E
MIGAVHHRRSSTITSVPSISGRPRSRMIAFGRWLAARASASRPVGAVSASYCLARRLMRSARTSSASSSTIRMPFG